MQAKNLWRYLGPLLLLPLPLLLLNGCGKTPALARISGHVTIDGKPLTRGDITFYGQKEEDVKRVPIGAEGKYNLEFPPGNAKITVFVPSYRPLAGGRIRQMDPAKFKAKGPVLNQDDRDKETPEIPSEYTNKMTTPLTYTVTPGDQTKDIQISTKGKK